MKKRPTGESRTDWKRLRSLSDDEIRRGIQRVPAIRPTDAEFWKDARRNGAVD